MSRTRLTLAQVIADDRLSRIAWSRLSEPGAVGVAQHVRKSGGHGPALAALAAGRAGGLTEQLGERLQVLDVGADLFAAEVVGGRVVVPGDDEWPAGLDELPVVPHCLWLRGTGFLADLCHRSVAIVGARACTHYGTSVAADLADGLSGRGWTVVSGAAFGIDAAAHRGALGADAPTIAVLATGIDRDYPQAHSALIAAIAATGVVVTELPPGSAALPSRFLQRNRLIAAVTRGTVVVEAGLRSGSGNTARHANELARPVGYVPGPVTSMVSAGCHHAIREGGTLVAGVADVAELLSPIGEDLTDPARGVETEVDRLPERERAVLQAMPVRAATDVAAVARTTALAPVQVLASLGMLQLHALVRRDGEQWKRLSPKERSLLGVR